MVNHSPQIEKFMKRPKDVHCMYTLYLMKTNIDKDQTNQDRRPNKKAKLEIN